MSNVLTASQLAAIADEFSTPLYVYNADKIKEQYNKLTSAFNGQDAVFFYACKALTNINILRYIKLLGANVNLGNIEAKEVIALEATRIGLRSDSFHFFL